eukprot:366152-Chlamydomonas_euryale.AAC.1
MTPPLLAVCAHDALGPPLPPCCVRITPLPPHPHLNPKPLTLNPHLAHHVLAHLRGRAAPPARSDAERGHLLSTHENRPSPSRHEPSPPPHLQ